LFGQQTYTLKIRSRPGDKFAFDVSSSIKQKGQIVANGLPQPIDQSGTQARKGTLEILAAENDFPTAIRVTFASDSSNSGTLGGQAAPAFPLAGKTITLRRSQDGQVTNDLPQQPDDQTLAELDRMLDPDLSVYPTHPVAVGDEWNADSAALARQFQLGPDDKVSMKCRFRSVRNLDGHNVAEFALTGEVVKRDQGFIVTTTRLDGINLIDLANGQTLQTDVTGKMSSRGTKAGNGDGEIGKVSVDADGQLEMHQRVRTLASGANPPMAAAPAVENPLTRHIKALAGLYRGDELAVDVGGDAGHYTGTITRGDKTFPFTAHGDENKFSGSFQAAGASFDFTAILDGDTLTLTSDGNSYTMKRAAMPVTAAPPKNPLAE
jgi:hypothetical protein